MEFFNNSHVELIRYDNIVMANHNVFIDNFNVSKTEKKKFYFEANVKYCSFFLIWDKIAFLNVVIYCRNKDRI